MRFIVGLAVGAAGYWAYQQGWLSSFGLGGSSSTSLESDSTIIRPTPQEVAGRPAEPIPGNQPQP